MNKKLVVALLFVAGIAGAACNGPFCYDDTGASISGSIFDGNGDGMPSMTLAQMNAATPKVAGQEIYVSDAVQSRVCVSSGTTKGAYVVGVATGSFTSASYPHCI